MTAERELATYLQGEGIGTFDTDLFTEKLPDYPDVAVGIISTGGAGIQYGFGTPGVKYEEPAFQFKVRGAPTDVVTPKTKAYAIVAAIAKIQGTPINKVGGGTTLWLMLRPLQMPFIFQRDSKERVVWVFNALAEKEPS